MARHPATQHLLRQFDYDHLSITLQQVARPCALLAYAMADVELNDGIELSAGLRKLLEAKDCFVRQAVEDSRQVPFDEARSG